IPRLTVLLASNGIGLIDVAAPPLSGAIAPQAATASFTVASLLGALSARISIADLALNVYKPVLTDVVEMMVLSAALSMLESYSSLPDFCALSGPSFTVVKQGVAGSFIEGDVAPTDTIYFVGPEALEAMATVGEFDPSIIRRPLELFHFIKRLLDGLGTTFGNA